MKSLSNFASLFAFLLSGVSMIMILFSLYSCALAASSSSQPLVGGPCLYKQYKGEAEIVSISERREIPGQYEIKFSFHPQEFIEEEFAKTEGKQWFIVTKDSSYPQEDFLIQYGIKVGKRLPCYLKVITKGTCTPVIFDLPTIGNGKVR